MKDEKERIAFIRTKYAHSGDKVWRGVEGHRERKTVGRRVGGGEWKGRRRVKVAEESATVEEECIW